MKVTLWQKRCDLELTCILEHSLFNNFNKIWWYYLTSLVQFLTCGLWRFVVVIVVPTDGVWSMRRAEIKSSWTLITTSFSFSLIFFRWSFWRWRTAMQALRLATRASTRIQIVIQLWMQQRWCKIDKRCSIFFTIVFILNNNCNIMWRYEGRIFKCRWRGCQIPASLSNPSWLVSGRTSGHQKVIPTFPWIDNWPYSDWTSFSWTGSVYDYVYIYIYVYVYAYAYAYAYAYVQFYVSSHIYPENLERTQVIVGSMNMVIYIRHCQESNSQPVPSQAGADPTRPQWQTDIKLYIYINIIYIYITYIYIAWRHPITSVIPIWNMRSDSDIWPILNILYQ